MTQMTVYRKGDAVTFESPFADAEAVKLLAGLERKSDFAASLVEQYRKRHKLSPRQWPWVHYLLVEALEPDPVPETVAISLQGLGDLLDAAAPKIKWPSVLVSFDEGELRISKAGARSKFPGSINVTSAGAYEDRTFYGRIVDGGWIPARNVPGWVLPALEIWAADPAGVAKSHGRRTGNCCFCSKQLTTEESNAAGYGPVCAKNYGLAWG